MVAAISTPLNKKRTATPTRPPLLPSESDNALAPPRGSKSREVTSRYMSSSSSSSFSVSKRCVSPQITRTVNSTPSMIRHATPLLKRSQSVGRKRIGTPRFNSNNNDNNNNNNNSLCAGAGNGNVPCGGATQKVLFTSTRSLSVSFQGESFSIQVSKAKPAPSPTVSSLRKCTPERRKTTTTPSRNGGSDQQPWPGKIPVVNCMNRNSDCGGDSARKIVRSLQNSIADVRGSIERNKDGGSEVNASDNESLSSSSSSEFCGGGCGGRSHATVVPARFWQEANARSRRQTENPSSPSSRNGGNGNKPAIIVPPKLFGPKKLQVDCPVLSPRGIVNSRGLVACSPIGSTIRPSSPIKLATPWSPSRGISPSQSRTGVTSSLSNRFGNEPSVLSFAVDVSRGKIWESRITDAHLLRLAYNRLLQWRFVNARADATLSVQTLNAEKSLYDVWLAASKLRESVRAKRTELQMLKQQFKLISILKEQMIYLEDWACLDLVYSSSLSGAIEGLKASTLRLPIVGGAKADVLNVKDAICSAMDVMQAMASSICLLLPKVGHINSLVIEVANLNAKERVLLENCRDLLSIVTAMQVRIILDI
ncbi:hypothetical protein TanjilG_24934 [Lupinus angustifolius]|uniref:QWRF motif-containing protein 2 n=1 Tax=Lupinus angustifolius TaxID=3871 RepID=A0A394DBW3_LUPAN|nr:hypothetical protein TanjilG_24934 [Lupinus angustifolius]